MPCSERLSNNLEIPSLTFSDQFSANPPILEMNSSFPSNLVLLMYGQNGSNYPTISGTHLSNTASWTPVVGFTSTNSFQFINVCAATNQMNFFRAKH